MKTDKREKRIVLYAAMILSPLIILLIQSLFTGKNLFLGVPTWTDELDYFREMVSFSKHGFNFGGSLFAGHEAPVGPLGGHSFSPVVAWGPVVFFVWNEHTILWYNLILMMISLAVLIMTLKPSGRNLLFVLILCYLYAPLNLYLHTSMMEVTLYGWIVIYSALFIKYIRDRERLFFILALIAGVIVTLMRMPYVVILFPLIWAATDHKFDRKFIRNMLVYIILFLVVYKIYNLFCADYPYWVTSIVHEAAGISLKLQVLFHNALSNLKQYFTFSASPVQVILRYTYGLTILFLLIVSFFEIKDGKLARRFKRDYFSFFVMSGGFWAIMIILYDIHDSRDFRTFSVVLFFIYLYVILSNTGDRMGELIKIAGIVMVGLMFAFSFNEGMTSDREIAAQVEIDKNFEDFPEAEAGIIRTVGSTIDVCWGNIKIQKSIPSDCGFKVYLWNEENDFVAVDYLLTTESYMSSHPQSASKLEYLFTTEDSSLVYRVIKQR